MPHGDGTASVSLVVLEPRSFRYSQLTVLKRDGAAQAIGFVPGKNSIGIDGDRLISRRGRGIHCVARFDELDVEGAASPSRGLGFVVLKGDVIADIDAIHDLEGTGSSC
ncbi:hypothetical protein [Desulfovibrio piger]|uniref:hypothetical protein n=1 Tax=Desulfovibrio piger TaxID=901 RepID=UPI003AB8BCE9